MTTESLDAEADALVDARDRAEDDLFEASIARHAAWGRVTDGEHLETDHDAARTTYFDLYVAATRFIEANDQLDAFHDAHADDPVAVPGEPVKC